MRSSYGVIVGQGRSGTKWLLELFDASPHTFCRNEPDEIEGSPFERMRAEGGTVRAENPLCAQHWDGAVAHALSSMGERDTPIPGSKKFLYEPMRRGGVLRGVRSRTLRRAAARVVPSFRAGEWPLPVFLGDRRELARSFGVLKFIASPGWASFVLRERREVPVIHLVRHPGGFVNGWATRWLAGRDVDAVTRVNRDRLHGIAAEHPRYRALFGDIEKMTAYEAELWQWYHVNQSIFEAGTRSSRYHLVRYEDLVEDAVERMREVYGACELPFDEAVEAYILETTRASREIAEAWRKNLSARHRELVDRLAELASVSFYAQRVPSTRAGVATI
jgi:hypothetical protein